jgi:hypothetical protein
MKSGNKISYDKIREMAITKEIVKKKRLKIEQSLYSYSHFAQKD